MGKTPTAFFNFIILDEMTHCVIMKIDALRYFLLEVKNV